MWNVKNGRLHWGPDPVAVRRVVVEMVVGRDGGGAVTEDKVRQMLRMERALSLRGLSVALSVGTEGA